MMVNGKNDESTVERDKEESELGNHFAESNNDENLSNETDIGSSEAPDAGQGGEISGRDVSLTERLRNVLGGDGDGDLVHQENAGENNVLQWLQALDLQVLGACRADERLKPLLKLNVSSGVAEDRLLAHLSQHFEAAEVGMLARCLCVPLVSIRVGKIIKQGAILSPTSIRGQLNLILLPSSDLQISFTGDDGCKERLAVVNQNAESSDIIVEEISADKSGRSFLIKFAGDQVSYFWCAEKSKSLGAELLAKMKDLLSTRPTLAQLTGISDLRLDCFAKHLRSYLFGSTNAAQSDATTIRSSVSEPHDPDSNLFSYSLSSRASHSRAAQQAKSHSSVYQGNLSPRSNAFKDGLPRNLCLTRGSIRERLRRRSDGHCSVSAGGSLSRGSVSNMTSGQTSSSDQTKDHIVPSLAPSVTDGQSTVPSLGPSPLFPLSPVAPFSSSSQFSPYYCWCPPCSSSLQYTVTTPHLPCTDSLSLPPLSALLSVATRPSSSIAHPDVKPPLDSENPLLDLPAIVPDPMLRFPLPVAPFISANSQQIPTFTPLMSDPIVHIPVVEVCSSGQGYLVSAASTISTTIAPLLPGMVNHSLVSDTESVVEKGARETLRLLISSSQTSPQLIEMLPVVFTGMEENLQCIGGNQQTSGLTNLGSRGLYTGARDVDAMVSCMSAMGSVASHGSLRAGCPQCDQKRNEKSGDVLDDGTLEENGGSRNE